MESSYKYSLEQFKNKKVSSDRLTQEIRKSDIIISIDRIDTFSNIVDIIFKSGLTEGEIGILDVIVSEHDGTPLVDNTPIIVRSEVLTEHLKYVETGEVTQGFFAAETILLDISSGDTQKTTDVSWKFDVGLISGVIGVSANMIGDEMEVHIAPNTLIGAIIAPLSIGDEKIYVSPTVTENIKIGYYFGIYQPGNTGIELGRIVEKGSGYVVIDKPSTVDANPGTYVAMCIKIIPYVYFNHSSVIEIGKEIPTAQRIPKNTIIRINYKNNNSVAKKISFFLEYLY